MSGIEPAFTQSKHDSAESGAIGEADAMSMKAEYDIEAETIEEAVIMSMEAESDIKRKEKKVVKEVRSSRRSTMLPKEVDERRRQVQVSYTQRGTMSIVVDGARYVRLNAALFIAIQRDFLSSALVQTRTVQRRFAARSNSSVVVVSPSSSPTRQQRSCAPSARTTTCSIPSKQH